MERPDQPARQHVERADVSGRRVVSFARGRAEDEQVAEHLPRRSRLRAAGRQRRAPEPLTQIHEAVDAKARNRFSCSCVELLQVTARREDDAAIGAVRALPVIEPAIGRRAFGRRGPDFPAGRRVEREHRAVLPDHIHHVVDDERAEGEAPRRPRRGMEPLQLELMHVGFIDLPERGILRPLDAAARLAPGRVQPRARLAAHDEHLRKGRERHRNAEPERESIPSTHIDLSPRNGVNTLTQSLLSQHGGTEARRRILPWVSPVGPVAAVDFAP